MAHVREESCFRPVDFGERFGALALLLIHLRVCNSRRNLSRSELKEILISLVKLKSGTQASNQKAGGLVSNVRADGYNGSALRRIGPRAGRYRNES